MPTVTTDRRQGVNVGAAIKVPCLVASTANITLSGLQTIDGVALVANDRVLVKNQTTAAQNGIYDASTSTWQRSLDWDGTFDVKRGTLVWVTNGTTNAGLWRVTAADTIVVGTTAVSFEKELRDTQNAESLIVSISDESTTLTSGVAKLTFRFPYPFTLSDIRASLTNVSATGAVQFDVNIDAVSILSTKLTIDQSEKTSVTAATPVVISSASIANDAEITIDIDNAGSGAAGAKITFIGRQTL